MSDHLFDQAIALTPQHDGSLCGQTSPAYANMVGPYGGITAAQVLNAVLLHPQRLGDPVSFTVNFCAPVADGAFVLQARAVRTNRSTQHWVVEMLQDAQAVATATVVTALRRPTWGVDDTPMPAGPAPEACPVSDAEAPFEFAKRFELRSVVGDWPAVWDGRGDNSLTQVWLRDKPPRPLDFASLASIADMFFPRIYLRRATQVPIGTVSMTVYFHAGAEHLVQTGDGYLFGQSYAHAFRNGFFDQSSQLWNAAGVLLATSHQVVYYKQ
jgi:acyl-CoA thioesterase